MITPEKEWLTYLKEKNIWKLSPIDIIILSPHPDDETLGAGGLIYNLAKNKTYITYIVKKVIHR